MTLGGTVKACEEAEGKVREILRRLKLELHPEKTGRVDLSRGRQGFDFLGCHLRKRMSGPIWERERKRVYFLQRWPSARSMKRVRQRVKEVDSYVWRRLKSFMVRRKGRNLRAGEALRWTRDFFQSHGLHRLRGTVKYPEAA